MFDRLELRNRHAQVGDRVFMVKLGDSSSPRGIFASGYITSDFRDGEHFDDSKDNTIMHVDVVLTKVLDYRSDNIITMDVDHHKIIEEYYTTPRLPIMDGIDDHTKFTYADGTTSETNAGMISVLVKMMRFGNM